MAGIVDGILIEQYGADETDLHRNLRKIMQICC